MRIVVLGAGFGGVATARHLERVLWRRTDVEITMASLGHSRAVAQVCGLRLTGFVAWWMRRTYYLFQIHAGTGDCASAWTGPSRSSSGRASRGLTCAWNESW